MIVGRARVSTEDQNPARQKSALFRAAAQRSSTRQSPAASEPDRGLKPQLSSPRMTTCSSSGSSTACHARFPNRHHGKAAGEGVGFRSLTEAIDTTSGAGRLLFHIMARWRSSSGPSSATARGPSLSQGRCAAVWAAASRRSGRIGRKSPGPCSPILVSLSPTSPANSASQNKRSIGASQGAGLRTRCDRGAGDGALRSRRPMTADRKRVLILAEIGLSYGGYICCSPFS